MLFGMRLHCGASCNRCHRCGYGSQEWAATSCARDRQALLSPVCKLIMVQSPRSVSRASTRGGPRFRTEPRPCYPEVHTPPSPRNPLSLVGSYGESRLEWLSDTFTGPPLATVRMSHGWHVHPIFFLCFENVLLTWESNTSPLWLEARMLPPRHGAKTIACDFSLQSVIKKTK